MANSIKSVLVLLCSLVCALAIAEVSARILGYEPFSHRVNHSSPSFFLQDAERGWRNKPGHYSFSYLPENGYPVSITIGPDGARHSEAKTTTAPHLELYGGSIGFGWGVSDGGTIGDRLAEHGYSVANFSSGGYGGLQALQTMQLRETAWRAGSQRPDALIYLQVTHHTNRTAGDASWMLSNERGNPRGGPLIGVPYASLNASGDLEIHPPSRVLAPPLRENLAVSNLTQQALAFIQFPSAMDQMRPIQAKVIEMMSQLAARNGLPFFVIALYSQPADFDSLRAMVKETNIFWENCTSPDFPSAPGAKVPNDGHPTAMIQAQYASCIFEKALKGRGI